MSDRSVSLPDARVLEVWQGGIPDGVPVVFHHGTPASRVQGVLGDTAARRQGVRLVSFSRPGYGGSTDSPPSLASVGVDTLRVADALGLDEFAVLGASGGGPYALATGLAAPERVRVVGVAAGVGPWRLIESPDDEDPDVALLALADAGDVAAAVAGFRAQAAVAFDDMLTLSDPQLLEEFLQGDPDADLNWLDAEAKRHWAADLREALRTYDGFARDNVAWGAAWDIDPASLDVPTWLWYGAADPMVPPSHGHWLAERIPEAKLVIRSGKGHGSTALGEWDDMLATLRDELRRAGRR